jgi:hypothetical protein
MNFKDLFFVSEENTNENPKKEVEKQSQPTTTKFPTAETTEVPTAETSTPTFCPQPTTPVFQASAPSPEYLNKALEVYQKGFDSLNQPGFDFYEFYQSVASGGIDNPAVYAMAFQMASAMDKTVTKTSLTQQADFYIGEIQKVYEDFVTKGQAKKQEVELLKVNENQSLTNELNVMTQQLEALKAQIDDRARKLSAIDSKYNPQLSEIDSKLAANSMAKDRILGSIQTVKQGINNNIK